MMRSSGVMRGVTASSRTAGLNEMVVAPHPLLDLLSDDGVIWVYRYKGAGK